MRRMSALLDRLFHIAVADAPLSREEQRLLAQISHMLELTPAEYSRLHDIYTHPIPPHHVLGVKKHSPRDAIKKRYHALMRRYHPDRFAAVRTAYDSLRDLNTRLRHRLFEAGKNDSVDAILEELTCRNPRRRVSLKTMLDAVKKP